MFASVLYIFLVFVAIIMSPAPVQSRWIAGYILSHCLCAVFMDLAG